MFRSRVLWIALAATNVGCAFAAGCYLTYASSKTYSNGEWVSASIITVSPIATVACSPPGIDDCPESGLKTKGGFSSTDEYNFKCISGDLCSIDEYAPGLRINSEQAWIRESTPCSMNQTKHDGLMTAESSVQAGISTSFASSISRRLQVTSEPTTSQPTTLQPTTLQPTTAPTPTTTLTAAPTTSRPTLSPSTLSPSITARPTALPTLRTIGPTSTPQPTANPTTAQPAVGRVTPSPTTLIPTPNPAVPTTPIPTQNPATPTTTSIPTPNPATPTTTSIPTPTPNPTTPIPTSIPTSAKPFTMRPTRRTKDPWKPHHPWPNPPHQCSCPCPGAKSGKNGKNGKNGKTTTNGGWSRTSSSREKYCPCPCAPVEVPTCHRCRPHNMGWTNTN